MSLNRFLNAATPLTMRRGLARWLVIAAMLAPPAAAGEQDICLALGASVEAHLATAKRINLELVEAGLAAHVAGGGPQTEAISDLAGRINPHIDTAQAAIAEAMAAIRAYCIPASQD